MKKKLKIPVSVQLYNLVMYDSRFLFSTPQWPNSFAIDERIRPLFLKLANIAVDYFSNSCFLYEIIKTKHVLIWRKLYFKLQYFGNSCCHYQAKIISREETDDYIIRYIKIN